MNKLIILFFIFNLSFSMDKDPAENSSKITTILEEEKTTKNIGVEAMTTVIEKSMETMMSMLPTEMQSSFKSTQEQMQKNFFNYDSQQTKDPLNMLETITKQLTDIKTMQEKHKINQEEQKKTKTEFIKEMKKISTEDITIITSLENISTEILTNLHQEHTFKIQLPNEQEFSEEFKGKKTVFDVQQYYRTYIKKMDEIISVLFNNIHITHMTLILENFESLDNKDGNNTIHSLEYVTHILTTILSTIKKQEITLTLKNLTIYYNANHFNYGNSISLCELIPLLKRNQEINEVLYCEVLINKLVLRSDKTFSQLSILDPYKKGQSTIIIGRLCSTMYNSEIAEIEIENNILSNNSAELSIFIPNICDKEFQANESIVNLEFKNSIIADTETTKASLEVCYVNNMLIQHIGNMKNKETNMMSFNLVFDTLQINKKKDIDRFLLYILTLLKNLKESEATIKCTEIRFSLDTYMKFEEIKEETKKYLFQNIYTIFKNNQINCPRFVIDRFFDFSTLTSNPINMNTNSLLTMGGMFQQKKTSAFQEFFTAFCQNQKDCTHLSMQGNNIKINTELTNFLYDQLKTTNLVELNLQYNLPDKEASSMISGQGTKYEYFKNSQSKIVKVILEMK